MQTLRNESTEEAREIWRKIDQVANQAPEWLKKHVEKVLTEQGVIGPRKT